MTLPPLSDFLRWVREIPAAFRGMPAGFPRGRTRVRAVVADLFETHFGAAPPRDWLAAFDPADTERGELNRLRWVLAACHVLWHPSLRATPLPQAGLRKLLNQGLAELAVVVPSERIVDSEERREELVRRASAASFSAYLPNTCTFTLPSAMRLNTADAHRQMEHRETTGKLLLTP